MASEFIRVNARLRPSGRSEDVNCVLHTETDSPIIRSSIGTGKSYSFDNVFGPSSDQATIFKEVGKRIIDGALNGINGTIFAYGQTGSGKTHTMLGPSQDENFFSDGDAKGLIPRCVEYLFDQLDKRLEEKGSKLVYAVSLMFVELYNEVISDLLAANCPRIAIRAESKTVQLQGAICENVNTFVDAMRLIQIGWENRRVGETAMNKDSSRSHAVLILDITVTEDGGGVINKQNARINLVDLAGSERQSQTQSSGIRLKEAAKINQSLCTLGRVIRDLSANKPHVPYRDSKLTLMIRDSLGGNSRTAVIVCVHPDEEFIAESLSTLQFAEHCRLVKNELHINREVTGESVLALRNKIVELENELSRVRKELQAQFDSEKSKLLQDLESYKQEIAILKREQEKAVLEDTIACCDSPPHQSMFKTPAAKKERRKTRFTLSRHREILDRVRHTQEPSLWGDQIADNKENIVELEAGPINYEEEPILQLKEIIRSQDAELAKYREESESYRIDLDSRQTKIEDLKREVHEVEKEKANLQSELGLKRDQIHQLERVVDELQQSVSFKENEITAMNSKLDELKTVKTKLIDTERILEALKRASKALHADLEKKIRENESNKAKIDEHEHHITLLKEQILQNQQINETEKEARRALREIAQQKDELEKELFETNEKYCSAETQASILTGNIQQKDEEIISLTKLNEDLQLQLSELTGHSNKNQKIKLMEKYTKENSILRTEKNKVVAELDRYKREFGSLKS